MPKVDLGAIFTTSTLLVCDTFNVSGSVTSAGYVTNVSLGKGGYKLIGVGVHPIYDSTKGLIFINTTLNNDIITLNVETTSNTAIEFNCEIHCSYLQEVE